MNTSQIHEPKYLKAFISSSRQKLIKYPFFNFLLERLFFHKDKYIQGLYSELINNILDTTNSETEANMFDLNQSVIPIFLDISTDKILKVLSTDYNQSLYCQSEPNPQLSTKLQYHKEQDMTQINPNNIYLQKIVIGLLSASQKANPVEFLKFMERTDFLNDFKQILKIRNKDLLLKSQQLIKNQISTKNSDILNLSHTLLKDLFQILLAIRRKNLLYCSALEIIDFVIKERMDSLIIYFNENMNAIITDQFFSKDTEKQKMIYEYIKEDKPIEDLLTAKNPYKFLPRINKSGNKFQSIDDEFMNKNGITSMQGDNKTIRNVGTGPGGSLIYKPNQKFTDQSNSSLVKRSLFDTNVDNCDSINHVSFGSQPLYEPSKKVITSNGVYNL